MLQLAGITLHGYGLVVGLAVALAWWNLEILIEKFQQKNLNLTEWVKLLMLVLIGARLWHVVTDWTWYAPLLNTTEWWRVFAVWHGGLSIIGAGIGVILGLWWLRRHSFWIWLDFAALILPWSQAVGRVANWINQELYGWPTQLPWGIVIDAEHRVTAVQTVSETARFHPLFAYEAIGMLIVGWLLQTLSRAPVWRPGTTRLWWSYLAGYSVLRFLLDFLRIDRGPVWWDLGLNQWLMLCCFCFSIIWLYWQHKKQTA